MKIPTYSQAEHRLYRLQAEWNSATRIHQIIAQDIAAHPEWNLEIGSNGPQPKTSTKTPEISNLSLIKTLSNQYTPIQSKNP